jgi:hypothetical protein
VATHPIEPRAEQCAVGLGAVVTTRLLARSLPIFAQPYLEEHKARRQHEPEAYQGESQDLPKRSRNA